MHQINISFVLIKEGAILELCTSASSEGEWGVMGSVHKAVLVSWAFASPGGQECVPQVWCRQGAGIGMVLSGSPGPDPLSLGTGDASTEI